MKQLDLSTPITKCVTLGAVIWIGLATAAFAIDEPGPDPEADATGEPDVPGEPNNAGVEGTTCKDRIPACTIFKSPPRPVTNQNYGGKL